MPTPKMLPIPQFIMFFGKITSIARNWSRDSQRAITLGVVGVGRPVVKHFPCFLMTLGCYMHCGHSPSDNPALEVPFKVV